MIIINTVYQIFIKKRIKKHAELCMVPVLCPTAFVNSTLEFELNYTAVTSAI